MTKARFVFSILAGLTAIVGHVQAQSFPLDKPIKLVVPYPPGGSADALARMIGQQLTSRIGKTVVIENVAGASGNIGTNMVARAAPDGHTLVLAATPLSTNPSFYKDIPFDVLKDLSPITQLTRQSFVLVVHPTVPANTVPELIALAKANPGKLTFASHSAGGATHLAAELFKVMAGIDMLHVPYKGQFPASVDLLAGVVNMLFDSASTAMPQVNQGKLKALATTGPVRSPLVANGTLPTMGEFKGLEGFNVVAWYGIMGPAGVPAPILERLATDINAAARSPEVTSKLNAMGFDVVGTSPKEFSTHVRIEVEKWARIVKASGAKL
jgi:tripartite-type tricarboxylate transporter receptor subunit TctC